MSSRGIPRTVKPRRPYTTSLPLLAVGPDGVFAEKSGELYPRAWLPAIIRAHPSALVLCTNPERLLGELHRELASLPLWQFRLSPLVRERLGPSGDIEKREEVVVNFFGWRRSNNKKPNRYFYPVAPGQFCRAKLRELIPADIPTWKALLLWGESLRGFCQAHELKPSPTSGGLAAQLLRHPRFYPEDRRKVPRATNEAVRSKLPGNYYELRAETDRTYAAALYIDQENAHHHAASTIPLPDPDHLLARGRFRTLESRPWVRPGTAAWDSLTATHGLLYLRVEVPPQVAARRYVPPHLGREGTRDVWVFTNELEELEELGGRVLWASAAWTSINPDPGIRRYAEWCQEEVSGAGSSKPWIKPTLLAAYGILAAKPRQLVAAFHHAESGEEERWTLGAELVTVQVKRTKREIQSPIANVVQRAMIEAETRRLSLSLARELEDQGREVFAVYADAVIVRGEARGAEALPILPRPWRVKDRLTQLQFLSPQAFESVQIRRLPGVPRGTIQVSRCGTSKEDQNGRKAGQDRNGPGVSPVQSGHI